MVRYQGEKMSKSLGNLVFVSELLKDWDPMAVRLALLDHDWRLPWEWRDDLLDSATGRLARWQSAAGAGGPTGGEAPLAAVRAALDDDLGIVAAVAVIDAAVERGGAATEAAELLGVRL